MNLVMPLMNDARLPEVLTMLLKALRVGPGSVNDQPPTEIHVSRPGFLSFKAVKRLYRDAPLASMGAIWKLEASKNANAKLMELKPSIFKSSGATFWHDRVLDHDS